MDSQRTTTMEGGTLQPLQLMLNRLRHQLTHKTEVGVLPDTIVPTAQ